MKKLLTSIGLGIVAGAFGTFILNLVTYLDMIVQGRSASAVPSQIAGRVAEKANFEPIAEHNQAPEASARRSATGALMGYATGLSMGIVYAISRMVVQDVSRPVAGVALGLAAMASSDIPATATNVTNPRQWSAANWMSDIIPHLAFGFATVSLFEELATSPPRREEK